jgi:hypothetical protein
MAERVIFEVGDSFDIAGRGRVYVGLYPFDVDDGCVVGRLVYVDDRPMIVRGVEWNLCHRPRRGDAVGMLLREATDQEILEREGKT